MSHATEPWKVERFGDQHVATADGKLIVLSEIGQDDGVQVARAVACVNACVGLDPAGIPDTIAAAWAVAGATIHDDVEALISKMHTALQATEAKQ